MVILREARRAFQRLDEDRRRIEAFTSDVDRGCTCNRSFTCAMFTRKVSVESIRLSLHLTTPSIFTCSLPPQMLQYRKAITNFEAIAAERANTQVESSMQMELLNRISRSQRGLASTRNDRAAILDLIERLEKVQAAPNASTARKDDTGKGGSSQQKQNVAADVGVAAATAATAQAAKVATAAATAVDNMIVDSADSVEGEWHLEYVSHSEEDVGGWDFAASSDPEKIERVRCDEDFCCEGVS